MSAEYCGIEGCTCPDPPTPAGNYPCLECGSPECLGDCPPGQVPEETRP